MTTKPSTAGVIMTTTKAATPLSLPVLSLVLGTLWVFRQKIRGKVN